MPFGTIDGVEYKFVDFSRLPDEVGGKKKRTLSGQRRGDVLWKARSWGGTIYLANATEHNALVAVADDHTPRTCAGDSFPAGGVSCHVEMTGVGHVQNRATFYRTASVVFREVAP